MSKRRRSYDADQLRAIYDSTSGYCTVCHGKLAFTNYHRRGAIGAWHVDHSNAVARGGTDRLNNLRPACIDCNLNKSDGTVEAARARAGARGLPLSGRKAAAKRRENALLAAAAGAATGFAFAGPVGGLVGGLLGAAGGHAMKVKRTNRVGRTRRGRR